MDSPRITDSLVACTASGAFTAMRRAQSKARSSSSSSGTISLIRPIRSASSAGNASAVSRNAIAAGNGICRGRRAVVPPPANRPRLGSITPKLACSVATRMSTPPSISMPPATHGPLMAATIGL